MAHYLGIHKNKPTRSQKAALEELLAKIDPHLALVVGSQPGEAALYVEAPDEYGASHMADKRQAVRAAVKMVMGE